MPEGMRRLVRDLQRVPVALGDGVKRPLPSEERPLEKMGKKLVAARDLPGGPCARARRRRREVARRRRPAAVRARPPARPTPARPLSFEQDLTLDDVEPAEELAARGSVDRVTRPALRPLRPRGGRHRRDGPARRRVRGRARRARDEGRDLRRRRRATTPDGVRAFAVDVTDRASSSGDRGDRGGAGASRTSSSTTPRSTRRPTRPPRRSARSRPTRRTSFDAVMDVNVKGAFLALPGRRRRDGARRARLDRERVLDLRAALARAGSLRVPPRARRDVRQAGRVLGLEVGDPQPDALPRDVLGEGAACA